MRVECWCALRRNDEKITGGLIYIYIYPKLSHQNMVSKKHLVEKWGLLVKNWNLMKCWDLYSGHHWDESLNQKH